MSKERRKIGYFWVKVLPGTYPNWVYCNPDKIYIAEWDGSVWHLPGYEWAFDYGCMKVLSKCLTPPKME